MPYGDETDGFFAWERELAEREGRAPDLREIPLAGDMLEKAIKRIGADKLVEIWTRWTGQPCDCEARKELINRAHERLNRWLGMGG